MKRIYPLILFINLSLLFNSCDRNNPLCGLKIPEGAFTYIGYDSTDIKIVKGWIKINFDDSTTISGEWELDKIGDLQNIGPQLGSGQLIGSVQDSQLFLNLNPQYADNNVFLICPYNNQKLIGKWNYVGFPGIINYGCFVAEKQ